jgi:hypothetical protein
VAAEAREAAANKQHATVRPRPRRTGEHQRHAYRLESPET